MAGFLERIGVALPIVQAGMGGGTAGHDLAAAVSGAGGLGTIGMRDPADLRDELAAARTKTDRPVAINLLLPFVRPAHWEVAAEADVVVTFWGRPERHTAGVWIHQVGSVDEALQAQTAGADAVIAQGVEAGGHVRGTVPALDLLERLSHALPADYPVLLAGGIAEAPDVREALAAGAAGVVAGTRFLLSEESRAHPEYLARLLEAKETVLTELFGSGWPDAPHRVVPNAATERWLRKDSKGPAAVRLMNRFSAPLSKRLSLSNAARLAARQRPGVPFFSPSSLIEGDESRLVEATPLYAGESVTRVHDVRPAGELTRELAG
jgi:NAD(P)H-dependent flavin oxidoreductase YrpB (nitropropane dioxygenase family)